ncbi:IS5 family transposase [Synechococcus sp. CBW1108]|uniref:IS5 family transposase n=1 Tax=Synechococcus sp. CBW1108 TaxID=1353147 RepID=UPI0018CEECA4|nr:IS5 family transposase [Synechococcus sp. CBW1108]QPN71097.1 IS5 family transposase [Synechococcus sp. CBW1108]
MYVFQHAGQLSIEEFYMPFGGKLDPNNRWLLLRNLIPWMPLESQYAPQFSAKTGAPAKRLQIAFGALYIQQRLGVTDRETVQLITESPYLQFFIGLSAYQAMPPFDPSMMVHFRKRIGPDLIKICNDMTKANGIAMIKEMLVSAEQEASEQEEEQQLAAIDEALGVKPATLDPESNWGTLILDATCVPDDIPYPVDLRLLNEAREATEKIIDALFKQLQGKINRKPRCNRDKARNRFLAIIKKKKPKCAEIREVKRFKLNEIRRNLRAIDQMIHCGVMLLELGTQLYRKLLITSELYRKQQEMYDADSRRIDDRIVNLSKPHVRPIVRGKAGRRTEFGAKILISDDNGFVDVDRISWDNYNEANDLIARTKQYNEERGYYPARICADSIYMTLGNKKFCAENNIRLSGRPRKKQVEAEVQTAEQQELFKSDLRKRSVIEGRIGTSKRKYGLDRIMTKLIETSRTVITMAFFVMNAEKVLRLLRLLFSILVSVYILMLYLLGSWRRPALLWAA